MVLDDVSNWLVARADALRDWGSATPKRQRASYWIAYTVLFLICCAFTVIAYPFNGKSIMWTVDGLGQYYPFFIYEGEWLRSAWDSLLQGQGLQFALWEWNLGYGSDVLLSLDVVLDPVNLLSAFAVGEATQWMYQFTIILRMYLAGVAFSLFVRRYVAARFPILCGALLYSLSVTSLYACIWPGGCAPLVLFPLLLLGAEKIIVHERPYLFLAIAFLFFTVSYYFSYMACILLVPFCIVRVYRIYGRQTVLSLVKWTLTFAAYLVLAAGLAAWILVPEIQALMGMDRVTKREVEIPLLYTPQYYQGLISGFISNASVGSDCQIGYGGIVLIACLLLFSEHDRRRTLKISFLVMTAAFFIPLAGSIMNGFNYATNRWSWAYALLVCSIVVMELPTLLNASRRQVKFVLTGLIVYTVIVFLLPEARTERTMAALLVTLIFCGILFTPNLHREKRGMALLMCIALSVGINGFYFIDGGEGGWAKHSTAFGTSYDMLTFESPNSLIAKVDDPDGYWRYDASPMSSRSTNDSLVLGISGIDFYTSLYNDDVDRFHTEMGIVEDNVNFSYKSLGARTILEEIAGVKYYLYPKDNKETLPYNYNSNDAVTSGKFGNTTYAVAQGDHPLPIGYTYHSMIMRSDYLEMTPAERQQALLLGAVVDDEDADAVDLPPAASAEQAGLAAETIEYTPTYSSGVSLLGDTIRVSSKDAWITLDLKDALPNSETYVYVQNLQFSPQLPSQKVSSAAFQRYPLWQQAVLTLQDVTTSTIDNYAINLQADKGAEGRRITNGTITNHMYGGKTTWLANLGYSKDAQSKITITFPNPGDYSLDELRVICQPMSNVNKMISKLGEETLQNVERGTNQLSGSIDVSSRKMLYLSVPYSKGWKAYVDGEEAPVHEVNTAFMGIMLDEGHHDVRLEYETPGLRDGAKISVASLAVLALLVLIRHRYARIPVRPRSSGDRASVS